MVSSFVIQRVWERTLLILASRAGQRTRPCVRLQLLCCQSDQIFEKDEKNSISLTQSVQLGLDRQWQWHRTPLQTSPHIRRWAHYINTVSIKLSPLDNISQLLSQYSIEGFPKLLTNRSGGQTATETELCCKKCKTLFNFELDIKKQQTICKYVYISLMMLCLKGIRNASVTLELPCSQPQV